MEGAEKATENEKDQTTQSPKLPDDIVFDVLSRLPVQSLLRFRRVCKSWRTLISNDHQFIKTHLNRSTKCDDSRRLMIMNRNSLDYFDSLDYNTSNRARLKSPLTNSHSYAEVLCSCDGLILLCVHYRPFGWPNKNRDKTLVLWNPSIRAHMIFSFHYTFDYVPIYGLCYDSSIDGYKVVILSQNFETFIAVYNLKNSSWSMIRESCYLILSHESGVFVNGALHWVMISRENHSQVVAYFDLVEEKLKELPRPDYGERNIDIKLAVLGGWLCIHFYCVNGRHFEVWAMKEYGKKESWINLFIIPRTIEMGILLSLKPLCFTKKGEVLMEIDRRELVIYNPNGSTFARFDTANNLKVVAYVESLVLPDGGYETQRHHKSHPLRQNGKKR